MAKKPAAPANADKSVADAIKKLGKMPSGYITDAMGRLNIGCWMDGVLPVQPNGRFCGPARTLRYAPKLGGKTAPMNIYDFIRQCKKGEVLVIETGMSDQWIMGENMAHHSMYQGLAAMVTDSHVRDFAEIRELKFPVFCRGAAIRRSNLELVGIDVPITCGGGQVNPGDILMGDPDGICIIPRGRLADTLYQAEDMAICEAEQERGIKAGLPMDKLNAIIRKKKVLKV